MNIRTTQVTVKNDVDKLNIREDGDNDRFMELEIDGGGGLDERRN